MNHSVSQGPAVRTIDKELALSRVGGDVELLREIAILFIEDYPKILAELQAATDRGDALSVERTAHSLKGSVSNFGANLVIETARKIEDLGRARQLADVPVMLRTLNQALAELRPELEAL